MSEWVQVKAPLVNGRNSVREVKEAAILPDINMAGVLGDLIPSALKGSTIKHFVSPKLSTDLPQPDINLISSDLVSAAEFNDHLEWEGGLPGATANKRKVSRLATGRTIIKLKKKQTEVVLAEMHVWVVWANDPVVGSISPFESINNPSFTAITAVLDFAFEIKPAEIILDAERPDLSGAKTAGADVPNKDKKHVSSGVSLENGANLKWDVSRQVRVKINNPHLYPVTALTSVSGHLWTGQPTNETIPEVYPTNPVEGNDDASSGDEKNNPYDNNTKVTSSDIPRTTMRNSTGIDGNIFTWKFHFKEFVRLNLGKKWYRVSNQKLWRVHYEFKKVSGIWRNNDDNNKTSTLQFDNADW